MSHVGQAPQPGMSLVWDGADRIWRYATGVPIQEIPRFLNVDFVQPALAFTDVLSQSMTVLSGSRIRIRWSVSGSGSIAGLQVAVRATVDGVPLGGTGGSYTTGAVLVAASSVCIGMDSGNLPAGAHTVRLQVLNLTGVGAVQIRPAAAPDREHANLLLGEIPA